MENLEKRIDKDLREINDIKSSIREKDAKMAAFSNRFRSAVRRCGWTALALGVAAGLSIGGITLYNNHANDLKIQYKAEISTAENLYAKGLFEDANISIDETISEIHSESGFPEKNIYEDEAAQLHKKLSPKIQDILSPYEAKLHDIENVLPVDRIRADLMMQELKQSLSLENYQEGLKLLGKAIAFEQLTLRPWLEQSYQVLYDEAQNEFSVAKLEGMPSLSEKIDFLVKNLQRSNSEILYKGEELSLQFNERYSLLKDRMAEYQQTFSKIQKNIDMDKERDAAILTLDLVSKLETEKDMDVSYMLSHCREYSINLKDSIAKIEYEATLSWWDKIDPFWRISMVVVAALGCIKIYNMVREKYCL